MLRHNVPWMMVIARALGGPLIVLGGLRGWNGTWLSAIVLAALLSDVYDGVLARRWDCETPALRLSDSLADTVFYLGVVCALWIVKPQTIRTNWQVFILLFGLEAGRYVFDQIKFGKPASYHSYLAKLWGLFIAVALVGSFTSPKLEPLIRAAASFGVVVNLEGLIMSFILPRWQNDVKTLPHAVMFRRAMSEQKNTR